MALLARILGGCIVLVHIAGICRVASEEIEENGSERSLICRSVSEVGCNITCEAGDAISINWQLEKYWEKNNYCESTGMMLTLNNFQRENGLFQLDWFTPNINVSQLFISFNFSTQIFFQPDALNYLAFRNLGSLTFENIKAPIIQKSALTNLSELLNLSIINSEVDFYEAEFLDGVKYSLLELTITESITRIKPVSLTNITDNTPLKLLQTVQFRLNLNSTISKTTFRGLQNVASLILESCNIEVIGPKSFDVVSNTLTYLNLNDNRMKTLPSGLFTKFISGLFAIDISNNPWHCDCNLEEFKMNLQTNNFRGIIECETPNCLAHNPVSSTSFCNRGGESVCVDYDEAHLVPPPSISASDRNGVVVKECYDELTKSCEEVQIKGQTKIKSFSSEGSGEITIEIDDEYDASQLVVIWFETIKTSDGSNEYYESSEEVSCQSSSSALFRVRGLSADTAYTICLVSKGETTISPLDCMPYYNQTIFDAQDDEIWILEEEKVKVIIFVVLGAVASLLFGIGVSFVLIRKNPTWLRGNDRVVRMSNTMNSDVMVMPPEWPRKPFASNPSKDEKPRRFSDISIISGKSYVLSSSNATEMYKRKLMEKRNSHNTAADNENKYYLDYLPHKIPPPLPPPNLPPAGSRPQVGENYYSDLTYKNNQ